MEDEIKNMRDHEQKIMEKLFSFTSDVASLKADSQNLANIAAERERNVNTRLNDMEHNLTTTITQAISTAIGPVGERMNDVNNIVRHHEELFDRVTRIQEVQGTQINSIQETLKDFKSIQEKINAQQAIIAEQNARIANLEAAQKSDAELKKEHTKGKWTLITSIAAGVCSVIGVILAAVLPALLK